MKIVFTPDWFLSNDVLINLVSFSVLFLFFLFAYKCYRVSGNKNIFYLGIGFLLIAIGELSTVLTKFILYFDTEVTKEIGKAIIESRVVQSVDIFYNLGFFLNKFFVLMGLYIIYKLPSKTRITSDLLLATFLIFSTVLLSQFLYYFYHLTALILLALIIKNYYRIYKKDRLANTQILIYAFALLTLSHISFMLSKLNYFYVGAQSIQLVSYIILLTLIMKIMKNGTKKKQGRNNARHA